MSGVHVRGLTPTMSAPARGARSSQARDRRCCPVSCPIGPCQGSDPGHGPKGRAYLRPLLTTRSTLASGERTSPALRACASTTPFGLLDAFERTLPLRQWPFVSADFAAPSFLPTSWGTLHLAREIANVRETAGAAL